MALPQNANLIRHWHVNAGLYTDAGVTAAGVGDDVLQWHDVVAGHVASQPTLNTSCPTLQADGLHFDGDDVLNSNAVDLGTGARTVIVLVKRGSISRLCMLDLNAGDTNVNSQYGVYTDGTNVRLFRNITNQRWATTISTSSFDTLAISHPTNAALNNGVLHVNGVLQTVAFSSSLAFEAGTGGGSLTIGARGTTDYYNGTIKAIAVWDVELSAAEIAAITEADLVPPVVNNGFAATLPNLTSALTAHVGAPPVFDATLPALKSALRAKFAPGGTDALFTTQLPMMTGALEADTVSNAFDTELPALTASLTGFIPVPVLFSTRLPKMVSALRARQQQTSFNTSLPALTASFTARTLGRNRLAEIDGVLPALTSGLTGNVDYKAFDAELPMLTSALEALTSREVTLEVTWTAQTVKELTVTWQVGSLQKRVDLPVTWFAAEQAVKELAVTWEAFDPNQQPTITRLNLSSNGARQRWRGSMQSFDELLVGDTLIELDGLMIEANIKSVVRDYQGDGITRYSAEFEVLPLNRSGLNAIIGIHNAPDYVKQFVDEQGAPMSFWEAEYIRKTSRRYTAREYFTLAANRAGVTIIFDERLPGLDALLPFDAQWDGYGMSFADALNDVFGAMKPRIYSDAQGRIRVESSRRPASVGTLQNATTRTITRSQVEDVTIETTYYGGNAAHLDFISGAPLSYNRTIVQRKFDTDGVSDGAEYLAQWWSAQGFESVPIEIYALKSVSNWWQTWIDNEVAYGRRAVDTVDAISGRAENFSRSKAALADRRGALLETKKLRTLTVTWEAVPAEAKQLPPTIDGQRITELDVFWSAV